MEEDSADEEGSDEICVFRNVFDAGVEDCLMRVDYEATEDIVEELSTGFDKQILVESRDILFGHAKRKVEKYLDDLDKGISCGDVFDPHENPQTKGQHMDQWEMIARRS